MTKAKAKKTTAAKKPNGNGKAKTNDKATGYKGHRAGTMREKIHLLYDKHGAEKARPMAEKAGRAGSNHRHIVQHF